MPFEQFPSTLLERFRSVVLENLGATPTSEERIYFAIALRMLAQEQERLIEQTDEEAIEQTDEDEWEEVRPEFGCMN